jgi:hypothetical protein
MRKCGFLSVLGCSSSQGAAFLGWGLVLASGMSLFSFPASAERKVCSNGYVSHSSCPDDFPISIYGNGSRSSLGNAGVAAPSPPSSAKVIEPQLVRNPSGRGLWKGHLSGDGKVRLVLEIQRAGQVTELREMGSVELSSTDKPTRFNFQSMLPMGEGWSWKVLAFRGR